MSYVFADNARADCLCFLVISQLVARLKTGAWLQTDRVAQLVLIWSAGRRQNSAVDCFGLDELSESIAADLCIIPDLQDLPSLTELFSSKGTLDYHAAGVQAIFRISVARLAIG